MLTGRGLTAESPLLPQVAFWVPVALRKQVTAHNEEAAEYEELAQPRLLYRMAITMLLPEAIAMQAGRLADTSTVSISDGQAVQHTLSCVALCHASQTAGHQPPAKGRLPERLARHKARAFPGTSASRQAAISACCPNLVAKTPQVHLTPPYVPASHHAYIAPLLVLCKAWASWKL